MPTSIEVSSTPTSGTVFPSTFVYKYMVGNYKYEGGGLGKIEQGMIDIPHPKT